MSKVIIRKTLCGCLSSPMTVNDDLYEMAVPYSPRVKITDTPSEFVEMRRRIFRFNGEKYNGSDVFEEVFTRE